MKFPSNFSVELENNVIVPVKFQLEFDGILVDEKTVNQKNITLTHDFDDDGEITHLFKLIMIGKKGNDDINEFFATVHRVCLDYVDITDFYSTVGLPYWHDGNGYQSLKQDRLHRTIGCDGSIEFYFSSPVYKWLPVITTPNYGY